MTPLAFLRLAQKCAAPLIAGGARHAPSVPAKLLTAVDGHITPPEAAAILELPTAALSETGHKIGNGFVVFRDLVQELMRVGRPPRDVAAEAAHLRAWLATRPALGLSVISTAAGLPQNALGYFARGDREPSADQLSALYRELIRYGYQSIDN